MVNSNFVSASQEHFLVVSLVLDKVILSPEVVPPAWQQLKSDPELAEQAAAKAILVWENKITIKKLKKGKIESKKLQSREDWKQSENIQVTFPKENLINEIKKLIWQNT